MSLGGIIDLFGTDLISILTARDTSKYLTAAGGVVLIYDHVLLFPTEVDIIWRAKWNWWKALFLFNRYSIPLYIIIALYETSGIAAAGLSETFCKTWMSATGVLQVSTLIITNAFVIQRVYALWDYNKLVLRVMVMGCIVTYTIVLALAITTIVVDLLPHVTISPVDDPKFRICLITTRLNRSVEAFALPVALDVFLLVLTVWNALDRPRRTQASLIRQLYVDGIVYFCVTTFLRLLNVLVVGKAAIAYVQLAMYFFWAMIGVVLNRMLLLTSQEAYEVQMDDKVYREVTPAGQLATPFLFRIEGDTEHEAYLFDQASNRSFSWPYDKSFLSLLNS